MLVVFNECGCCSGCHGLGMGVRGRDRECRLLFDLLDRASRCFSYSFLDLCVDLVLWLNARNEAADMRTKEKGNSKMMQHRCSAFCEEEKWDL